MQKCFVLGDLSDENVESKFVFEIIVFFNQCCTLLGQSIGMNMAIGISLFCSLDCEIQYSGYGIALLVVGRCGLFVELLDVCGFG